MVRITQVAWFPICNIGNTLFQRNKHDNWKQSRSCLHCTETTDAENSLIKEADQRTRFETFNCFFRPNEIVFRHVPEF